MITKILSLSKKLIAIESASDNKKVLSRILNLALGNLNNFTIERFEKNGTKSALIYNSGKRPKIFKLILNGHLDIIPGKDYQYLPEIKGNRLYGAGSLDMKANLACMIMVFKEMAKKVDYPLGLQMVTDEEIGGFNGTKYQLDKGVKTEFAICGETTQFNINNQAKGILWLKISAQGKTSHSAYPWNGDNVVWKMNKFVNNLSINYPQLHHQKWQTTVNLSHITTTNRVYNKIPDYGEIWLDIRFIPKDANSILKKIGRLLPAGFKIEVIVNEPPQFVDKNNKYIKKLKLEAEKVIGKKTTMQFSNGSSDARHFTEKGVNAVCFGAIGGGIGQDNEYIDINSLKNYYQILKKFLLSI